jgi:hypothetical protein
VSSISASSSGVKVAAIGHLILAVLQSIPECGYHLARWA